jgi:hypothetical protein
MVGAGRGFIFGEKEKRTRQCGSCALHNLPNPRAGCSDSTRPTKPHATRGETGQSPEFGVTGKLFACRICSERSLLRLLCLALTSLEKPYNVTAPAVESGISSASPFTLFKRRHGSFCCTRDRGRRLPHGLDEPEGCTAILEKKEWNPALLPTHLIAVGERHAWN